MRNFGLCFAVAAACVGTMAAAAPSNVISDQVRTVSTRSVQVLVAQSEIKSNINPSNIAVAAGGGLLFALVDAARNDAKTKKAEASIEPVRGSLTGFDADALALETTKSGLAKVDWLQSAPVAIGKDSSLLGKSALVEQSDVGQVDFIEYSYDLSPDFSSVRVVARLQFANKTALAPNAKPETRVQPRNLAYVQQITSIVTLPNPSKEVADNAGRWSADSGKAVRSALKLAFDDIQALLPRTLALTDSDIKAMQSKDHPRGVAGGFAGRIQDSGDGHTMLWSAGFIHAVTLPATTS